MMYPAPAGQRGRVADIHKNTNQVADTGKCRNSSRWSSVHASLEWPTGGRRGCAGPGLRAVYLSTTAPSTSGFDDHTCNSAACTSVPRAGRTPGMPVMQSELFSGSLSWSPWNDSCPVHWFDRTTRRTCVAVVLGTFHV